METGVTERWAPIPGYEGLYEASDMGRIRSLDRVLRTARGWDRKFPSVVLKGAMDRGYVRVALSDRNRNSRHFWVHRLILLSFVGPCPDGMETLHGEGGPSDNRLVNLRWGTSAENNQDILRHGNNLNANKRQCKRGHALKGFNLILRSDGGRECRSCRDEHGFAHRERRPFVDANSHALYEKHRLRS